MRITVCEFATTAKKQLLSKLNDAMRGLFARGAAFRKCENMCAIDSARVSVQLPSGDVLIFTRDYYMIISKRPAL